MMVDPEDWTKVISIRDWDYANVRPVWFSGYNWTMSVFRDISLDGSRFAELWKMRNDVFQQLAPEVYFLQHKYRHIAAVAKAAWNPGYGDVDEIIQTARDLVEIWPKGEQGPETVRQFLQPFA